MAWQFGGDYAITQIFGVNPQAYRAFGLAGHAGVDFAVPCGTPVRAPDTGYLTQRSDPGGYGLNVTIDAPDGKQWELAHFSAFGPPDGWVDDGQIVGYSGTTGNSTGCHLHVGERKPGWELRLDNGYFGFEDPLPDLGGGPDPFTDDTFDLTYPADAPPAYTHRWLEDPRTPARVLVATGLIVLATKLFLPRG